MEKEKRGVNFTKSEIDLLIDIVLKYKHIIENKRTDATNWREKNEAWEKISEQFNACSGNFPRSTKTIRSKYDTIKKSIRKKCSFLKSEQTKTGGGQCQVTLTASEEKILSLTPNTMVGLAPRFDTDGEPGPSGLQQWMPKQSKEGSCSLGIEDIEFVDDESYDVLEYLKTTQNVEVPKVDQVTPGTSANTGSMILRRNIDPVDYVHVNRTRKGTDTKSVFKNKRAKRCTGNYHIMQENMQLKNEILELQKKLLLQELQAKAEINKLTIQNLELDIQLKQAGDTRRKYH